MDLNHGQDNGDKTVRNMDNAKDKHETMKLLETLSRSK